MSDTFTTDLQLYGPNAQLPKKLSAAECRRYCRRLARRHYENFTVVSWLLPRALRQHFYHIYAYCRWADDLADETAGPKQALALLQWWESLLHLCYRGEAEHPVFVALGETIREFNIPIDPLADLLVAFRQDQQVVRYETPEQLIGYCRYSANPVGRLVLFLGRCHDGRRGHLADSICTGLQLANFCQDVARDYARGRVYLPQSQLRRFGCDESMLARGEASEPLRRLLEAEVTEAEGWLRRGQPLVGMVPAELRLDVALFVEGGLAILEAIRRQKFDVWSRRPVLSKFEKLRLAARVWWQLRQGTYPGCPS
jgi:squalene synthase HpnC